MQERIHLMKNKTKFAFLTVALSMGLIIGACSPSNNSSSSSEIMSSDTPISSTSEEQSSSAVSSGDVVTSSSQGSVSSSSVDTRTYTVKFAVDGRVVKTSEVKAGELAAYDGETPTKNPDANVIRYRFKNWDKDIDQPITADTTFNAVFAEYVREIPVDDFENYSGAASLKDAGWAAWTLGGSSWTTETQAAVSVSRNAADGNKALRLDAWQNNCDFKAVKTLKAPYEKAANAIQFKLMIPSEMKSVKILLKGQITIEGKLQAPSFSYILHPTSSEYMEYTIPLADAGWALWDDQAKSIKAVAGWMGIHEDDYLNYLTSIDFYARGDDGLGGQPYTAFIDSIKFVTLDNAEFSQTQREIKKYDRYTGTLSNGHTLRVDLANDGNATAKIIDLEQPQTITGTYVIQNEEMTFTSADSGASLVYKGALTNGGQLIKYKSATGQFADAVSEMNLDAVQVVNDFEQYSETGIAYSQKNDDETTITGLRGDFYSEYYVGSGSSDWAGGGWQQMPEGDEINLIKDANSAHGGKNYASFKHFSQNGARYMPWDLFKGNGDKNSFRGKTFSFWAKGYVNKLKMSFYSQSRPTNGTRDKYVKEDFFNEGKAVDEWTHFEIELNPKYVYYGFIILIDNDYQGDGQLLIDDIEVYGASPYAAYKAPEVKKLTQNMSYLGKINDLVKAQLFIKNETQVDLMIPGLESTTLNGTYVFDEKDITMTFDGDVYVASVSEDMKTFTFKSISGTGKVATYLNNLSFKMFDYADNAEAYANDGLMYYQGNQNEKKRSGARGAYYCQYLYDGSWILMGGSGDQLGLDTTNHIEGQKSLKMKKSTNGDLKYTQWGLYDGTAEPHTNVSKFTIWLKNPLNTATNLQLMLYKVQKVTKTTDVDDNKIVKDITLEPNQEWTEYTINLDPTETYYGYCINAPKASANGYFNVDNAYYYSVDNNPNLRYFTKKDMVLNGNLSIGEASIKFDECGKFYLTCATLQANNVEGTYDMALMNDSATQEMTLSVSGTVVKGTYLVDATGKATFTVTDVTGAMATYIEAGKVFANQ